MTPAAVLVQLLGAFQSEIVSPDSMSHLGSIEEWVTPGPQLSAADRMDIYRRSYVARLVECLVDDYPALRSAMGEARFDELCAGYIERYPSMHPSLNAYGKHMSVYCASLSPGDFAMDFAAELAELEWCLVQAVHAPAPAPLANEALSRIGGELAEAKLRFNPSLQLREFTYPVNDYFQAWAQGFEPDLPCASPNVTAVFRSGYRIVRRTLEKPEAKLLQFLLERHSLSSALARVEEAGLFVGVDASAVSSWFQRWMSDGWIAAIDLAPIDGEDRAHFQAMEGAVVA